MQETKAEERQVQRVIRKGKRKGKQIEFLLIIKERGDYHIWIRD